MIKREYNFNIGTAVVYASITARNNNEKVGEEKRSCGGQEFKVSILLVAENEIISTDQGRSSLSA